MKINISDLENAWGRRIELPLRSDLPEVELDGEIVAFVKPLEGIVRATGADDKILVEVKAGTVAEITCSRCLESFRMPVRVDFEEEYRPGQVAPGREGEEQEDEEGRAFSLYRGDEVDVTEPVRQNLLLELPMKPVCRPDCRGLCPSCGKNWNEGRCQCEKEIGDPRFAVLKSLFDKKDQE